MHPFHWMKRRKGKIRSSDTTHVDEPQVGDDLSVKLQWFRRRLSNVSELHVHEMRLPGNTACAFLYIMNMVDQNMFQDQILSPLRLESTPWLEGEAERISPLERLRRLPVASASVGTDLNMALDALLRGTIVAIVHKEAKFIQFPMRSVEIRSIADSENESVIRGPKEAFVEDLSINLTMIRRRIKHPAFKTVEYEFGTYTKTKVIVCYIEDLCEKKLIEEVKQRLSRIEMDGVIGSSYIEEFIEDNPFSPFPQVQYTERPDIVSAALLEGRVSILVDGTPIPIIVPVTLTMLLQSAEDYYQRFIAATWIRWIRYFSLLVSFLLPSIYIAVSTFHPEMLPENLLITVAAARENVPFPAIVEAMVMELTFEALREAGLRIPKQIGQTVSIIGALVIGQAAVQAGIVSAPMVIVVSITGVASFIIPHFDLGLTFRLLRFPIMILAASFGLYGVMIGILLIYVHLVSLRSFGTPYLSPLAPIRFTDWKDVLVRAPWWMMRTRPHLYGNKDSQRMKRRARPQIPEDDGD